MSETLAPADRAEVDKILEQMLEKRPLPVGRADFDQLSERIISGTCLSADPESQKFALTQMLLHLSPTQDHECDGYFIKALRKAAVNQVADSVAIEIRDKAKARLKALEEAKAAEQKTQGEVTADTKSESSPGGQR